MLRPIWNTQSGLIATINAGLSVELPLDVANVVAVELISKSFPLGLKLTNRTVNDELTWFISGIPQDLGIDKEYDFVLRASNNTGPNNSKIIQDRTFKIIVTSSTSPVLLDPEGTLNLVNAKENYVLNKSTVYYQFQATSPAIPKGQTLRFYIEEGSGQLPPGLKLSKDGVLYGTIDDDLNLDYKTVQGTYDKDYYDMNPYDYSSAIETANASVTVNQGKINTTALTYGGNGYILDPEVIIGGSINQITIVNKGSGYTTAPEVLFSLSPTPGGVTATGYAVLEDDLLPIPIFDSLLDGEQSTSSYLDIIDGGDSISEVDTIIDGGQANPFYYQTIGKRVGGIVITNPGTGYTTAPTITFKDQNTGIGAEATCNLRSGSGAQIAARVSNGSVVALDIINTGSGYSTPPLISFGLPTAGAKIISRVYKFAVTVSNGEETDTKTYTILVKSEDSLRVDTTFISSDTQDFDTSKTYVQSPIWISPNTLPTIKGDNNFIYDLAVFDPTPSVGKIYFSLMDVNFDGTESQLGPPDEIKNAVTYQIVDIELTRPAAITLSQSRVFKDGDRIKLTNVSGTTQLNNGIFYVKNVDGFKYQLFSDRLLINPIDALLYNPFTGVGQARFQSNYLSLDFDGGEISGFIPYQPSITKTYNFTVKAVRIIDDVEVASVFKQFDLTVKGNIEGEITFTSPALLGSIRPNEQSLFEVEATSTIPSSSIFYSLVPGYGKTSKTNYIELDFSEQNGKIYVEGYGLNPVITFDKGQTYKINVSISNFTMSFRNIDDTYYNFGLRHSTGAVEESAQEKSNGYFIFTPPFSDSTSVRIVYTNIKKNGLILTLKRYNSLNLEWEKQYIPTVYDDYTASAYYEKELFDKVERAPDTGVYDLIPNGNTALAVFINWTKVEVDVRKYNPNTFAWESQNYSTTRSSTPSNGEYWIDLDESNFGLLDFRYVGLAGVWVPVRPTVVNSIPSNSVGINYDLAIVRMNGVFKALRKSNNTWKYLERLPQGIKGAFDPNVFYTKYDAKTPSTNLQHDIWFKYTSLFNGEDAEIYCNLKSLDSLPTELTVGLNGDIIGKISPNTGSVYRSFYTENRLYLVNDVITFDNNLYICVNQYRSSGNWISESVNWQPYFFPKRVVTSIDANIQSESARFSIAGPDGTDGTTIDKLFRFRVRASDTQNVGYVDQDFNIEYLATTNVTLTNIYLQPFLTRNSRDEYFNFITDPIIFPQNSIYRLEDSNFGIQRIPKMLLLGGIESTSAERYASAVQRNYYDRPLYFGEVKSAIAKKGTTVEYEVVYIEINDPYEINNVSVAESIKLGFDYDLLTADYTKIRMDTNSTTIDDTGIDTVYPSSITLMQKGIESVSSQKTESVLVAPIYDGPYIGDEPQGWGLVGNIDPPTEFEDWGLINERVAIIDDFLSVTEALKKDDNYRPLWMNTSQDGTGNIIGYVKAIPICYLKPGESAKVLELIRRSNFDFKKLNFTIDRIIIQNPQGGTGDKYIKFINREII
jgi:hypothetical protein